jgi:hypothetical protein
MENGDPLIEVERDLDVGILGTEQAFDSDVLESEWGLRGRFGHHYPRTRSHRIHYHMSRALASVGR